MFDAFDEDGGGTVDADEITNIVVGLFRLGGIEEDQDLLAACVYDVIEAVDKEGDGDISKAWINKLPYSQIGDRGIIREKFWVTGKFWGNRYLYDT